MQTNTSTPTISRTAVVTAGDWYRFKQMTLIDQENWLDEQWAAHAAAHGQEFGEAWPSVPFNPRHDHRLGACTPPICCVNDSFSALVAVTNAPITDGPVDDDQPTPEDIEANAGPTLVTICRDSECWDVVATANSPQWSEVA